MWFDCTKTDIVCALTKLKHLCYVSMCIVISVYLMYTVKSTSFIPKEVTVYVFGVYNFYLNVIS